MASKYKNEASSIYNDGTDVPKNKFNLTNSTQIHELERELISEAYEIFHNELDEDTIFDENYFIALHQRTFGELYEWAGIYRDFNMAKGESRFCQGAFVSSSSKKIFEELKKDNYLKDFENKPKELFAKKLAYYKCEINALHPFCELNGRVTRMFFDMIVAFNGYKFIDYSTITPKEYIGYAIDCVQYADESGFEKIILNGLNKI